MSLAMSKYYDKKLKTVLKECHKHDKEKGTILNKFEKSHPKIRQQNKLILHANNKFFF